MTARVCSKTVSVPEATFATRARLCQCARALSSRAAPASEASRSGASVECAVRRANCVDGLTSVAGGRGFCRPSL